MGRKILFILTIFLLSTILVIPSVFADKIYNIPSWMKDKAKWWSAGQLSDNDFVKGIQYMAQQGIVKIQTSPGEYLQNSNHIPQWIKNNAKWWSKGQIDDSEFVDEMQYLVQVGIIQVSLIQQANLQTNSTTNQDIHTTLDASRLSLYDYALQAINSDRMQYGVSNVTLDTTNQAAQAQADDILKTGLISHWMTDGEKPYMEYTRYGGLGNEAQNVAMSGNATYRELCQQPQYSCEIINPFHKIKDNEYAMIYHDEQSSWDHRANILNKRHTDVSIGVAYENYTFVMVQNFENNYINYTIPISENNGMVSFSGNLKSGSLYGLGIYYDPLPTPELYQEHKNDHSYQLGSQIAIVQPPPSGGQYFLPSNDTVEIADRWMVQGDSVDISFDISPFVSESGVYTIVAYLQDSQGQFPVTSYSITKTSPMVQVGYKSPKVYYACSSEQISQFDSLQQQSSNLKQQIDAQRLQFDALNQQYSAMPKTSTSQMQYQQELQIYNQLNSLQSQVNVLVNQYNALQIQLANFRC
jgi:uncharacterized protein YkwD